jgi:hypothetical protein
MFLQNTSMESSSSYGGESLSPCVSGHRVRETYSQRPPFGRLGPLQP